MSISKFIIFSFLFFDAIFDVLSCEKKADISSPKFYEKNKVSFSYPKNWRITEDVEETEMRYIFIETPGDAIFIIQIYSKEEALSLSEYAEWSSEEARKQTPLGMRPKGKFSEIEKKFQSKKLKGIREYMNIIVLSESVPHITDYYKVEYGDKAVFLICQVAVEDLKMVKPGFEIILKSFMLK